MHAAFAALAVGAAAFAPISTFRPAAAPARVRHAPLRSVAAAPAVQWDTLETPAVGYDKWASELDYPAFRKEVHALGTKLGNEQGVEDVKHLQKMIMWSNGFGAMGLACMWMSNPLGRLMSIIGLSTWTCTRWTMIGHHISHGGYNRQDKSGGQDFKGRYTTYGFAVGSVWRRARDWFDWMLPEAWNIEHNNLHHYRLGEAGDPDLVERNLELMRSLPIPKPLKYVAVAFLAAMWKWYYYAPNTYKQLKISEMRKRGEIVSEEEAHEAYVLPMVFFLPSEGRKFGACGTGDYPPADLSQREPASRAAPEKSK